MRLNIAVDGIKEVQQQLRFSDRRLAAWALPRPIIQQG